ncbi:primase-helicase zinc-binding domain-containing protein [Thauera terpenica]
MGDRLPVRDLARGRWRGILPQFGLTERHLSGKHGPCPLCGGKDRFRFDDKEGRGTYYCSACGPGDGVQLAEKLSGLAFSDLARKIEALVGVVPLGVIKSERSVEDKLAAVLRVWGEARKLGDGDESILYLRGRGLALPDLPMSIRTHPGLRYVDEDGVVHGTFPVMLAAVVNLARRIVSVHRTYLSGGKKAPVPTPKKLMSGAIDGAAIRLSPVSRCLGIAEGIETALAASGRFDIPVWSCISTSGIESFVPPAGVEEVIVFADNDANFAGQAAAYRAAHRLALRGYSVKVVVPPEPGDWLDVLRTERG